MVSPFILCILSPELLKTTTITIEDLDSFDSLSAEGMGQDSPKHVAPLSIRDQRKIEGGWGRTGHATEMCLSIKREIVPVENHTLD